MQVTIGTLIELNGTPAGGGYPAVAPETARVVRAPAESLPMPAGYHAVRFSDGKIALVHAARFRVIGNR